MSDGETNPVTVQRNNREAKRIIREAICGMWQIEKFYTVRAQRGPYKKNGGKI